MRAGCRLERRQCLGRVVCVLGCKQRPQRSGWSAFQAPGSACVAACRGWLYPVARCSDWRAHGRALHLAAARWSSQTTRRTLVERAHCHARSLYHWCVSHFVVARLLLLQPVAFTSNAGQTACVRLLLEHGISPVQRDYRGHSPLMVAVSCRSRATIALLLAQERVGLAVTRDIANDQQATTTNIRLATLGRFFSQQRSLDTVTFLCRSHWFQRGLGHAAASTWLAASPQARRIVVNAWRREQRWVRNRPLLVLRCLVQSGRARCVARPAASAVRVEHPDRVDSHVGEVAAVVGADTE